MERDNSEVKMKNALGIALSLQTRLDYTYSIKPEYSVLSIIQGHSFYKPLWCLHFLGPIPSTSLGNETDLA